MIFYCSESWNTVPETGPLLSIPEVDAELGCASLLERCQQLLHLISFYPQPKITIPISQEVWGDHTHRGTCNAMAISFATTHVHSKFKPQRSFILDETCLHHAAWTESTERTGTTNEPTSPHAERKKLGRGSELGCWRVFTLNPATGRFRGQRLEALLHRRTRAAPPAAEHNPAIPWAVFSARTAWRCLKIVTT